jgi:hypothetical protein
MTDPNGAAIYIIIWCSMDPIHKNPQSSPGVGQDGSVAAGHLSGLDGEPKP